MHPRIEKASRGFDVVLKGAAVIVLIGTVLATVAGKAKPAAQEFLGIPSIKMSLVDLKRRVSALEPSKKVVKFDMNRSRRSMPACAVGSECSVLVVMNRTRFGQHCGRPTVTIYVINGMGTKHSAEFRGHAPSAEHMVWTRIHWKFVVPTAVHAGDADVQALIEWDCPNGRETQTSPLIPVVFTGDE